MSTPRYVPCYYVQSPISGAWMRAPLEGSSLDIMEAHPYPIDSGHLAYMVGLAAARCVKLRLRQAKSPQAELAEALERDIEATPAPEFVECPDCGGDSIERDVRGDWRPCARCHGTGNVPAPKVVCPDCEGTGLKDSWGGMKLFSDWDVGPECKQCDGKGTIPAPKCPEYVVCPVCVGDPGRGMWACARCDGSGTISA